MESATAATVVKKLEYTGTLGFAEDRGAERAQWERQPPALPAIIARVQVCARRPVKAARADDLLEQSSVVIFARRAVGATLLAAFLSSCGGSRNPLRAVAKRHGASPFRRRRAGSRSARRRRSHEHRHRLSHRRRTDRRVVLSLRCRDAVRPAAGWHATR